MGSGSSFVVLHEHIHYIQDKTRRWAEIERGGREREGGREKDIPEVDL
jgi:hypothetical protein